MTLYKLLDKLSINYKEVSHNPVYTSEEAMYIHNLIEGFGVKNLFLKSDNNYYLVLIPEEEKADLKLLERVLSDKHLSFAKEEDLVSTMKLTRGSVTPFGIINDTDNKVTIVINKNLLDKKLLFHPNVNTKTLSISYYDLIKFIEYLDHNYIIY